MIYSRPRVFVTHDEFVSDLALVEPTNEVLDGDEDPERMLARFLSEARGWTSIATAASILAQPPLAIQDCNAMCEYQSGGDERVPPWILVDGAKHIILVLGLFRGVRVPPAGSLRSERGWGWRRLQRARVSGLEMGNGKIFNPHSSLLV